jgi:hypothetical protein
MANPSRLDLVSQVVSSHGLAMMVSTQAKEGLYHDGHSTNTFFPIAIEVFGCLHYQADDFLH